MEAYMLLPIILAVLGGGWLLSIWLYICMRMRWHEKGILDFSYDGHDPKQNPEGKTIFDFMKIEREYDRKMKEQK